MCFGRGRYVVAECSRKVTSLRRVAGAISFLVNGKDLQLECARVLHEMLFVPALMLAVRECYGGRRRDLGLGLYRSLLGIRRMDRVPKARKRILCGVKKGTR